MNLDNLIKESIDELNEQLNDKVELANDTHFVGSQACLDSIGFVTFISILEEKIQDELDKTVQLVDEKAFSSKNSPFYSVETLKEYIAKKIQEA